MDFFIDELNTKNWQKARKLILERHYQNALDLLEPLVKLSFHPELWIDYAQVLFMEKQLEKSLTVTKMILKNHPMFLKAHTLQAHILYKKGYYKEALKIYRLIISKKTDDVSLIINAAYCLCQLDQFEDALYFFEQSEPMIDNPPGAWLLNYGMALLFSKKPQQALPYFMQALSFFPQDSQLLFHLGLSFDLLGQLSQAIFYYKESLRYNSLLLRAHHNLAILLYRQGDYELAAVHLRFIVTHDQNNTIAATLLAAHEGTMLDSLPLDFIKTLFDQYAFNYDHHLKDVLAYQAPATARSLLYSASPEPLTAGLVLDLGCGTGLMGATMRDLATTLIGIDVSAGMLQHAKNTGLYDEMIEKDVLDYLAVTQCKAKYITAIEVLNYLGKTTEQLIEYSSKILQDGGWLIMTAEISTNEPIVFNHYARYAYTQEYLISILLTHGFDIKEIKKAPLRMHEESMVEGFYVIASLKHAHKELSA